MDWIRALMLIAYAGMFAAGTGYGIHLVMHAATAWHQLVVSEIATWLLVFGGSIAFFCGVISYVHADSAKKT